MVSKEYFDSFRRKITVEPLARSKNAYYVCIRIVDKLYLGCQLFQKTKRIRFKKNNKQISTVTLNTRK